MGIIGVHDYDFFNYQNVLPNLECAKICAYYKKHREIAVLAPNLTPELFSTLYVRKDYEDGLYPKELFNSKVIFGGRAIQPGEYQPLDLEIEKTIPDFSIYERHLQNFRRVKEDEKIFKRILGSAHIRLSLDGKTINPWLKKEDYLFQNTKGIILHDYDVGQIAGAYDFIKDWLYSRNNLNSNTMRPYSLGVKFPIQVNTEEELIKWLGLPVLYRIFDIQYNNYMEDSLCDKLRHFIDINTSQLSYKIDEGCISENDFVKNRLPLIIPQVLFFHRHWIKISLIYNDTLITSPELQNLIEVLNWFVQSNFYNYKAIRVVDYCKWIASHQDPWKCWKSKQPRTWPSTQDARDAFMYVRFNNYEAFRMFYEWRKVVFDGGKIINDPT